ncbi:vesicular glutamate transporter 2 isoform X2 [Nematostella vectensis]|uniref:vesicular glutamate transporter 2 isoform X2 n=1 Tax=Nematostella vectensis TaxID=45351 RepID=UPI0020778600|nr:vesicular glutamate transporter 2 isoform X2 [Nematostella vectensis]
MASKHKQKVLFPQLNPTEWKGEHELFTSNDDRPDNHCCSNSYCLFLPKRYCIAFLTMLAFLLSYGVRAGISIAVVAMVSSRETTINGTITVKDPEFRWSTKTQGVILGSFFGGYMLTQVPGGVLAQRFGGRVVLGLCMLFSSIFVFLSPVAARTHVALLVAASAAVGSCKGVMTPALYDFWNRRAPYGEKSTYVTFSLSGVYIGLAIIPPVLGQLESWFDWPSIFYSSGAVTILLAFVWFIVVKRSPVDDSRLSDELLSSCEQEKTATEKNVPTPWKKILTSLPVWSVVIGWGTSGWMLFTFLTELPSYLKFGLGYDIKLTGVLYGVSFLAVAIMLPIMTRLADFMNTKEVLSMTNIRKLFTCGGSMATLNAGVGVNAFDIAPRYSGIIMGMANTLATFNGIMAPLVVGLIVKSESIHEWGIVFLLIAAIVFYGAVFYAINASGELQPWATPDLSLLSKKVDPPKKQAMS